VQQVAILETMTPLGFMEFRCVASRCVYVCIYMCVWVCMCVCMHVYVCIVYIYIYIYMCVCVRGEEANGARSNDVASFLDVAI
jgi:hypothetical protein